MHDENIFFKSVSSIFAEKIQGQQDFLKTIVYVDEFFYGNSFRALSVILHHAFFSNINFFDLFYR
jgi:hypothetical protein